VSVLERGAMRALAVEDDPALADLLRRRLWREGHVVDVEPDGTLGDRMTRRVHTVPPGERKETPKALAAYACYRGMGSGRSISRLHAQFVRQAAESWQNQGKTPMPPTTSRYMIEEWSSFLAGRSACPVNRPRLRRPAALR
jgi:hypothetical protein